MHTKKDPSLANTLPASLPNNVDKFQQAFQFHQQGQLDQAEILYEALLKEQAQHIDALHFLGVLANQRGQAQRAADLIKQALNIDSNNAAAHSNLGLALLALKQFGEALASFDRALDLKPNNAEAYNNRGNALLALKRPDEAIISFDRALSIKPDYIEALSSYIEALSNRGIVLRDLHRLDEALASYQRILEIKPDSAEALINCGIILYDLNRIKEALVHYERALAINPNLEFIFGYWLFLKMKLCDWRDFDNNLTKLEQGIAQDEKISVSFAVQAVSSSIALQKKAAICYSKATHPSNFLLPPIKKHAHAKIKIAYFSSDFRYHPVSYLTAELFERHDRSRFEVIAFSFHVGSDKDDMRLRLEAAFDEFIDVSQQSDEQIARLARQLEIDIAIDLNGLTENCRTDIFALRVAPIQVSYIGYLGTMGTDYIDYLLADATLIPKEHHIYYTEKIAYLPHSFQVNDSTLHIADKSITRAEMGLPEQGIVFCCFNNHYKITPTVFAAWMRILQQVKGSVLWLVGDNTDVEVNLRHTATASGIDAERLVFAKRVPMPEHLARHRLADLFLDTAPYNAGATASAALWAGLPVLTYLGETFSGRMGASLLRAIGLSELIANSLADYEALAIQLATHPKQLAAIKQKLADNRLTYPLFDTALFTQHIESAYQTMVDRYQAGLAPDHIYVSANDAQLSQIIDEQTVQNTSPDLDYVIAPADALYDEGNAFLASQHFEQAIAHYDKALIMRPNFAEAYSNRGIALQYLRRLNEALASYDRAVTIKPDYPDALYNRGIILRALNRFSEARSSYEQALAINPNYEFLFGTWLYMKMSVCDWSQFDAHLNTLTTGIEHGEKIAIPFFVQVISSSAALQKQAAEIFVQEKCPSNFLLPPLIKQSHSKIKLAYFSSDFRNHPVSYLMAELFECHDRSKFEIIAFSFSLSIYKDESRLRLEKAFDQFIDVSQQSDEQVVRLARQLEIDIAVDLNGFTDGCRVQVFAMRVAPIQVNYLGYASTMSADYIDYLIADSIVIPDEYQPYYSEKIAYLPNSYMVSDSTRLISNRRFTRAEMGLPAQGFVFCCFNNAYKITPPIFDIWMRLLHQVKGSVLWLSDGDADAVNNLRAEASKRGINAERLIFAKRLPLSSEHLARHCLADLFLDTLPYNAHTTTNDALWCGLPVLTCVGETFASRVAASLLSAIGLPELITSTAEDYEALAIQLATHPEQLAKLKQKLADNRLTYPLFNTKLFAQHIESAYQAMFDRYQANKAPAYIYVQADSSVPPLIVESSPQNELTPAETATFHQAFEWHQQGQLEYAETLYNQVLQTQPQHADTLHLLGVIAKQRGQNQTAIDFITQALKIDPNNAAAHSNRGLAFQALSYLEDALTSYEHALLIAPDYTDALFNQGIVLQCLKRFDEAIASYDKALTIQPDHAEIVFNKSVALEALKRFDDALASYDRTLSIQPDSAEALFNRGNVLVELKRYVEALASYEHALAIKPDLEFLYGTWLHTKMNVCDWRELEHGLNQLSKKINQGEKACTPFVLQAISSSPALLKKAACCYAQAQYPSHLLLPPLKKHTHSKIKIAYFSADFRNHPVAHLMAELFERHDRSRFEVIAFAFSPRDDKDDMRLRLEAAFDQFIDVSQQSDEQVVQLARQLEIDIAIDLNGLTKGCRTNIFAMRAAPIQMSYIGYLGTMGADYIDYLLADSVLIPTEQQADYCEKIAYLPHSFQVNDSTLHLANKTFTRAELDLPEQGVVFCCFNSHYKITPTIFDSWMRILHHVKGSVLWLVEDNIVSETNLRREATARGIEPERLIFAKRLTMPDYLARHQVADLFLDTAPYNAGATASAALWAGLPVLTCLGDTFSGRMGASLLHAIGLPELVTQNLADYEALAIQLATHPEQLAAIKQTLVNNRLTYPLFDTALFTQHIEAAYQAMFDRYQADKDPDHIYVQASSTVPSLIVESFQQNELTPTEINLFHQAFDCHQQGQLEYAETLYKQLLQTQSQHADTLHLLGVIAKQRGQNQTAIDFITQALKIDPNNAAAHSNRGLAFQALNRLEDALTNYEHALLIAPDYTDALFNQGIVLQCLKRFDEALASYDKALTFQPDHAETSFNKGVTLQALRRLDEALASYERALAIQPNYAEALSNRGNVLLNLNRYDEALVSYERALAIQPNCVETLIGYGVVLEKLKRFNNAMISYKRALAINPDYQFLFGDWLYMKMKICNWNEFKQHLNELTKRIEQGKKVSEPFSILTMSSSANLQKKVSCCYVEEKCPNHFLLPKLIKYAHSKIKIGYFSADFRHHPVSYLTAELFERHNKSQFEIIAFSFHATSNKDDMRLRLEAGFDQFIDVSQQSDEQVVQLARQLEIDIAVDLTGFTDGCRTNIFAMRVAPIQVNYLGYSGTMGADYMDYLLADSVLIPTEYQSCYAEKIVYLPNSYMVNDSTRPISNRKFTRAELDLPEQGFVFCCFNNAYKITPAVFDVWMQILHQVKGSVLWLSENHADAVNNLQQEASKRGIAAERLIFAKRLPLLSDHLARHRLADLFLDTLPYNAHTTTSDALWAGLPVLTLIGETFAARVAASLLHAIGLPELVTNTPTEYQALAIQLATHPEQLAAIKQKLANNRLTYPLFDTALFTQHIESAYQAMFDRYQAGLAPDHIYVQTQALSPTDIENKATTENQPKSTSVLAKIAGLMAFTRGRKTKTTPKAKHSVGAAPAQANETKFAQAQRFHQQGQLTAAETLYEEQLKVQPNHTEALRCLDMIKKQREHTQRIVNSSLKINLNTTPASSDKKPSQPNAINWESPAPIIDPKAIEALIDQGNELEDLNRLEEALASYDKALSLNPNTARAHSNRGNVLQTLKRFDEAIACYKRALAIRPDYAEAHYNRGNALYACDRFQEAIDSYDRALAIKPDFVQALISRGNALHDCKRATDALLSYERALVIQPDCVEALHNRGNVLLHIKRQDEALASYERALAIQPNYVAALIGYGVVLQDLKRFSEAFISYGRALAIKPDLEYTFGDWLYMKMNICDWDNFDHHLSTLTEGIERDKKIAMPFPVLAMSSSAALQKKAAHCYAETKYPSHLLLPAIPRYAHQKIKIAYFSSDFRHHPVAYLMAELFERHDRSRFEVIAFSFHSANHKDDMQLRLETGFDQFIDVSQQSDEQVVQLARQMEIDIAIDLNGFSGEYRTHLFAMRVAPVQVSYLGYLGTMGADYMDYLLADLILIPKEHQQHYCEKIAYLPHSFQVNDSTLRIADKAFTRAELGLPEQGFIFCCFNNNYKITPMVFDSWMRILHQVEGSVLWLLGDNVSAKTNLQLTATTHGIDAERLIFAKRVSMPDYLAAHRLADLFLDTSPYNAGATASAALWGGLPVLTYLGDTFSGRMGASLLHAIGLPELVTQSIADYEALAIQLATHPEQLAALKQKLADNRLTYPLFNTVLFTQHIESAYQIMFDRYQAGLAPDPIYVPANTDEKQPTQNISSTNSPLVIDLDAVEALINQGNALEDLNRLDEALSSYDNALAINPDYARAHSNRGNVLQSLKRFDAAIASYDRALAIRPDYAEAFYNRGNALQACNRFQEAIDSYDRALAIKPDFVQVLISRGNALHDCKRSTEALTSYEQVLAIQPNYIEALYNQGGVLQDLKRYDDALASYNHALAINPDYANAHLGSSWCYLLLGDFDRGWKEYEWRWQTNDFKNNVRNFPQPLWLGDVSLQGKTILLHSEQGFGDTLHFCRYAKQVADLGARVILEVPKALFHLLANLEGVHQLVARGNMLPVFDLHCPLLSLPLAFKTRLDSIPVNSPYLFSEPDKVKHWQAILGEKTKPRVGLVWSGNPAHKNDQNRSLSLHELLSLLTPHCQFISLQKELNDADRELLTQQPLLQHYGEQLHDFTDTAALCELMDVVISVCTSVAHLSAAMGKPTWILLSYNACWRWLIDREDSPWYPTVRLFRQSQHGDWQGVMERLRHELIDLPPQDPNNKPSQPVVSLYQQARLVENKIVQILPKPTTAPRDNGLNSDAVETLINQGNELEDSNRLEEALASYDKALSINPNYARAHSNRGNVLQSLKRFDAAIASYDRALAIRPDYAEAFYNRGNTLQAQTRFDNALASYDRALALKPEFVIAVIGRGVALQELKRFDDALASYDRALAIQPDYAEALYNRGNVLQDLKRFDDALASYDRALAIRADYVEALTGSSVALQNLKRFDEAISRYDRALAIQPSNAEVYANRGIMLHILNRLDDALNSYEQALAIKPDLEFMFGTWLSLKMKLCNWRDFDTNFTQLSEKITCGEKVCTPFFIHSQSASVSLQQQVARCYVQAKHPSAFLLPPLVKHAHSKIKIAYFSADFRNHPVANLMAELFERHDKSRFEVFAFSFHVTNYKDATRLKLESLFDAFIDVSQQTDEQVVQLARQMEIDIAIDLNGFTEGCRTNLFAMRVAPIQVNYLGYLGTMGADYMDYILADSTLIPAKHRTYYDEKIVYLPHSFQVNDSKLPIADKSFTRAELGLPEQGFVFCCFNSNYKITPVVFDSWMRILQQVEGSVLWLLGDNDVATKNLCLEASARGIDTKRLCFAQRLAMPEYLARHRVADLFLDTQPYNAGATASAALWAGLPILTCLGETFSGRMGASLLHAIGLPELITNTLEDYEALAIQLATHPEQLAAIKQKLADNRLIYPLFDTELFTQHIESAYQAMFDRYQSGLAPDHIYVSAASQPLVSQTEPTPDQTNKCQQAMRLHQQGQLAEAEALYEDILKTQPQHVDVLHFLGVLKNQQGQARQAVDLISQSLALYPDNATAHSNLGLALQVLNRFDDALASYDRALIIQPDNAEILYSRGNLLLAEQRFDDALASYDRALVIQPDAVDILCNRGIALQGLKRLDDALASYDRALVIKPDTAEAFTNRGNVLKSLNRFDEALDSYEHALAIAPDDAETLTNRGNVQQECKCLDAALESYNHALAINPDYAEAHANRGNVLHALKRYDDALASYERAIAIKPDSVEALAGCSLVLQELKRFNEAAICYERALTLNPDYQFLFGTWLFLKMRLCDWHDFDANLNKLEQGIEHGKKIATPFSVLPVFASAALQQKVSCFYAQEKYPSNFLLPPLVKHTHEKIKLGYFSADFYCHATAHLMAQLFENHDRSRFEIIAFVFNINNDKDDTRLRLEAAFDQFIDVSQQSDEQIAQLARQLEIDIAIDLKGFTEGCRTGIFALRAAPIQVNYLGYPSTMGADYIDYLLADSVLIPTEYQPYYTEKIAYLPNSYQVNDTNRVIANKTVTRAELGLPEQGFVFCCFNNNFKITPTVFDSWMRLLQQVQGSVLWLLEDNATAASNLRQAATARGIDPERLYFAPRLALPEHLARHRVADLFLDTLPCNAHTTTSDALWAGLPVLTCMGETFASRVAASLLHAIGLPELITTTLEDYEALAIQLATHPEQLAAIKQKLADNRLSYPLFNTKLFTQHIEAVYQAMFDRYQADLAPAHIYVSDNTAEPAPDNTDKFQQAMNLHQQGQLAEAEALYEDILQTQPQHVDVLHFLGVLKNQGGQAQTAVDLIQQSLALHPNNAAAHSNLGLALQALNRFDEALINYEKALVINPDAADIHRADTLFGYANTLYSLKRFDEALLSYERSLAINPDNFEVLYNRGVVLTDLNRIDEAIASYQQALTINPSYAEAHNNLASLFKKQTRYTEAQTSYQNALAIKPDYSEAHCNLINLLKDQGYLSEAKACLNTALAIIPNSSELRFIKLMMTLPIVPKNAMESALVPSQFDDALTDLANWLAVEKLTELELLPLPFLLAYRAGNHVKLLSRYGDLVAHTTGCAITTNPARQKITMVIVSHHFHRHSVWDVITRGILVNLDRTRFELILYHLGANEDQETTFAKSLADEWRDTRTMTDLSDCLTAFAIDKPDVIFYPEIGMDPMSAKLAARRIAPLQVTSWGHPITTGLPTIDLYFSGDLLESSDADSHYRERLIRLPSTGCCTTPINLSPEPLSPELSAELAARRGVRFVIAQTIYKFEPADDALYAEIARTVGDSTFILLRDHENAWAMDQIVARLEQTFMDYGLNPKHHLLVIPRQSMEKFQSLLDVCDVYLDCPSFSGYTTAWQAVHRGIPIVTLEGEFMRQRLAAGLLRKIGMTDTIANSREQYVQLAAKLAEESRNPSHYAARRQALKTAAPKADNDVSVVRAFEQSVIAALAECSR